MSDLPETLIKLDKKRKYGLYRIKHNKDLPTLIKDLSYTEVDNFVTNSHYVNDFFVMKERVIRAEINLNDLVKASDQRFVFDDQNHYAEQLREPDLDKLNANRLASNFVYSWFNCIELIEVQVKKEYGEKSLKWNEWVGIKKSLYNNNFEYRFLYHARHYQHVENLITGVFYAKNGSIPVPVLSKPYLLKFDAFQRPEFAEDWKRYDVRIPALPIFLASIAPLKEASKKHLELNKDFFLSHANSINGNFGRFSPDIIGIGVKPIRGIDSGLEVQKVQIDLAKHIIDYYFGQS